MCVVCELYTSWGWIGMVVSLVYRLLKYITCTYTLFEIKVKVCYDSTVVYIRVYTLRIKKCEKDVLNKH